jgi:methyl coenzyme M reductase subunit C
MSILFRPHQEHITKTVPRYPNPSRRVGGRFDVFVVEARGTAPRSMKSIAGAFIAISPESFDVERCFSHTSFSCSQWEKMKY